MVLASLAGHEGDTMNYPGGKNGAGVYQWIINHMPPHAQYVEAFLGSGAILRLKKPAPAGNIGIDIDEDVITAFRGDDHVGVTLVVADAIAWLSDADLPGEALVYCDPPYLLSTRRSQRALYVHEMTNSQHCDLLRCLRSLRCRVMVSGYWSELYASLLSAWRTVTFQTRTRGGSPATEWLWMNYPPPLELHDYRHLGKDFRERERIKRKKQRWLSRLQAMPDLERWAVFDAIDALRYRTVESGEGRPSP